MEPSKAATQGRVDPSDATTRSKLRPAAELSPGLYLVATPIGNLGDITLRALETLASVDVIACEDTRTTRKLVEAHGIKTPLTSYHEHNAERVRPRLLARIAAGESVALVTDAGTPLVSDPGYKLVRAALAANARVTALPGPSAALAALTVSGLPSDRFLFAGFLPAKAAARKRALAELAAIPASLIFYESARRLPATLAEMAELLGQRPAAVARELTKLYEEVRRDSLPALAAHYAETGPPKGEVVIVVGPPEPAGALSGEALDERLLAELQRASLRDAVARIAAETGLPRQEVYARALTLRDRGEQQ
ncbi:MAG TPA: 16S rRNA (cytidine(1402)-2'-O)-methyltransferase [Kiloniellales bacterium]|nr:16S rRNA (cytidine(1402)-2'-O)-methyltransferase [Kiloniellales bacterium]